MMMTMTVVTGDNVMKDHVMTIDDTIIVTTMTENTAPESMVIGKEKPVMIEDIITVREMSITMKIAGAVIVVAVVIGEEMTATILSVHESTMMQKWGSNEMGNDRGLRRMTRVIIRGIIMAVAVAVVEKEKSLMTDIDIVMKGVNAPIAERNPAPAETAGHGNNILDDSKVNIDSSFLYLIYLNCVMLPTASLSSLIISLIALYNELSLGIVSFFLLFERCTDPARPSQCTG